MDGEEIFGIFGFSGSLGGMKVELDAQFSTAAGYGK
jgi:hypothetical protein